VNVNDAKSPASFALGLRAGDWVEVRSAAEILATLDERGCLDALPFMPEMLKYCGKRFQVFKSAHKACDTIQDHCSRRMDNAVHLMGLRCDGEAHGGCQARCLLFWKEAWLKRVSAPALESGSASMRYESAAGVDNPLVDLGVLARATRRIPDGKEAEGRYSCQATTLREATKPLRWWAGVALAAYAVCVWPANFKHAIDAVELPYIPDGWLYHGPRLAFQPVLIWWALYCAEIIDWPRRRAR